MLTIRDLLNDLLIDAEERIITFVDKDQAPHLTDDDKEELLDEYTDIIKERIVG